MNAVKHADGSVRKPNCFFAVFFQKVAIMRSDDTRFFSKVRLKIAIKPLFEGGINTIEAVVKKEDAAGGM